ncbi:hypothetical protein [Moorena sp. SIO3I6]|uniref:hypothetical protein n=1 Tax=Moorena sp. SIO3I6 TaxID=2607831 RepID=UPI0013F9A655|nr:hypothetical protein [Moorena sp. SIO3I6]NEP27195.1 hypothetical protein [Moorena sp. SIO3I6]
MRYTGLFHSWLLPNPCSLKPRYLYLTSPRIAIVNSKLMGELFKGLLLNLRLQRCNL